MTIALDYPAPVLSAAIPVRLAPVGASLWRVIDSRGVVIGHVQAVFSGDVVRFRARRFHAPSRGFRDLGDFWAAGDAVDCLRFAR